MSRVRFAAPSAASSQPMNETSPSSSGRRFRKLRIPFSAVCGIVCLLLIALWVRSYRWIDECTLASRLELSSFYGRVDYQTLFPPYSFKHDWHYSCHSAPDYISNWGDSKLKIAMDQLFKFRRPTTSWPGSVPHWFLVLLSATIASAPWVRQLKWRFSLRTLLIAMTLVAVLLGAVVWAVK
jgi:hypothetical protein